MAQDERERQVPGETGGESRESLADAMSGPNEGGGAWTMEHEGRLSQERHAARAQPAAAPSGTYRGMAGSLAHGVIPTGESNVTAALSRDGPPVRSSETHARRRARYDTPELSGQFYRVELGDTLPTIAARFYGRAEEWERIAEANRDRLGEERSVYPGQEILIPDSR